MNNSPTLKSFMPTIIVLNLFGWSGLISLLNFTEPMLGSRILFFTLIVTAFTGISLPIIIFLNKRFPTSPTAGSNILLRESIWVGVYFSILTWLSYGRVISFGLALIFFVGIISIEFFLRFKELSQWRGAPPAA